MISHIKKKLSEIKNEVKEFHPLLEEIFPKLKNIKNVEYTHGSDEMGADFVLSKYDETLDENEYIGVIVKIGSIKQDSQDIKRQIEECELERYIDNGKKKIHLSEIWVVTNDSITANAKTKIHHNYKNKNIKFLGKNKIARFVDAHAPYFWKDMQFGIGQYLQSVNDSNNEIESSSSILPIKNKNLYVEQSLENIDHEKYTKNKIQKKKIKYNIYDIVSINNFVLIEGGMGSGKSKLLRHAVDYYSIPENYIKHKIQVFTISYREFQDKYKNNISNFVNETNSKFNIKNNDDTKLIFIDGIDEVKQSQKERVNSILALKKQISDNIPFKIVIASRAIDDPELETQLNSILTRFRLSPLSIKNIVKFIESICSKLDLKSRIIEDLKNSQLFRVLPKTPIAAILLAKLINENFEDLPSNMTELYSKYMELSLGRWDLDRGLQSQKEFESLSSIMIEIAQYMLDNDLTQLSISEFKQFFENYLKMRNLDIDPEVLFNNLVERCDLISIINDKTTVVFRHKTFIEFFYAQGLQKKTKVEITNEIYDIYWMNSYFFYVGLIKDCKNLIQSIIDVKPQDEKERMLRIVNLGNFLLAGYTTEYEVIQKGIESVFLDTVKYYFEIKNQSIESFFSQLPEMHLLALFRTFLYNSYSYSFFYPAIEDTLINTDSLDIDDDHKALFAFLLNIAYIDIGGISILDDLIKQYGNKIPFVVQLGIIHEADFQNGSSSIIKKLKKRVKKMLTGDKFFKEPGRQILTPSQIEYDNIYNKPISKIKIT